MNTGGCPRPGLDQEVNIVILGQPEVGLMNGRVLFEQGRGLIVEVGVKPDPSLQRGDRAIVVYAAREGIYSFRADIGEVISDVRLYLAPTSEPKEMEKREYIRATMVMPAFLSNAQPDDSIDLPDVKLELSASGFRWFDYSDVKMGEKAWLRLGLDDDVTASLDLSARVVRVDKLPSGTEVAGQFLTLDQRERDALLRIVFSTRLSELGLQDEEL